MSTSGTSGLVRGLLPEDPFVETYLVRPGGATVFGLGPDERMTVVDARGGQAAEVTALSSTGREDHAALGAAPDGPATVIRAAIAEPEREPARRTSSAHAASTPREAVAIHLFGEWSPAGSSAERSAPSGP